jgi:hypothetical protein
MQCIAVGFWLVEKSLIPGARFGFSSAQDHFQENPE